MDDVTRLASGIPDLLFFVEDDHGLIGSYLHSADLVVLFGLLLAALGLLWFLYSRIPLAVWLGLLLFTCWLFFDVMATLQERNTDIPNKHDTLQRCHGKVRDSKMIEACHEAGYFIKIPRWRFVLDRANYLTWQGAGYVMEKEFVWFAIMVFGMVYIKYYFQDKSEARREDTLQLRIEASQ